MSNQNPKVEKPKKHQVFIGKELKAESNSLIEITAAIEKLQQSDHAEIKHVLHETKQVYLYQRAPHELNYRITNGTYIPPVV